MALENKGINYGAFAEHINGPVHIYNTIEAKKKLHSLMPKFIEIFAQMSLIDNPSNDSGVPLSYRIEDKIKHNQLSKYKSLVDDYGNYYTICKSAFKALDNIMIYSKERILRSISEKYKAEKRLLVNYNSKDISDIELIRENSDYIIDQIIYKIKEEVMINCNEENIVLEDIEFCLPVFLCYAFVECKILERPDNYDYISR